MNTAFVFPHELAITAIIKDEGNYIEEWLDYHIAAGVTKFYIYDNGSTDNIRQVLAPYLKDGTVEYIYYPGNYRQLEAYNESLLHHKFECRYMGFIDIDEFLLPLQGERLIDILDDIMAMDAKAGGIAVTCKSFGSSGHKTMPSEGVLKGYLHRAPDGYDWCVFPWKWDAHVKTITNPRRVLAFASPHHALYYWNCYAIDENGNRVDGMDNFVADCNRLRVNHYFTKSWEEWVAKQHKGKADVEGLRPLEEFEWRDRNDVYDDAIVVYYEQMKSSPCRMPPQKQNEKSAQLLLLFLEELYNHREKEYYQGEIENLLCYWWICYKESRLGGDVLFAELLEQVILEMCNDSLGAPQIFPAQIELMLSVWKWIGENPNTVKKKLRENLILALKGLIEIFRTQENLQSERQFTDLLQKFLLENPPLPGMCL